MARFFDQVDDRVALSLGGVGTLTALSIAVIMRHNNEANSIKTLFSAGTGTAPFFRLQVSGGELLSLNVNGTIRNSTTTVTIAKGWLFVCATKPAGTSTGRAHIYQYDTGAWAHENLSGTLPDPGGSPATGLLIGAGHATTPQAFHAGDIAAVGVWGADLTDAQVESMAYSLMAWWAVAPVGMWLLDQADTAQNVVDITGGGANQSGLTGTTVTAAAVPVLSYGVPPTLVERLYTVAVAASLIFHRVPHLIRR